MTYRFCLAVTISILTLIGITSESFSCDAGFYEYIDTLNVGGCDVEIKICAKCATGPAPTQFSLESYTFLDHRCPILASWTPEEINDAIIAQISTYNYLSTVLCPGGFDPQPCANGYEYFILREYICWKARISEYLGETYLVFEVCDMDNYCIQEYGMCWNGQPPPFGPYIIWTIGQSTMVGTPPCSKESWEIILPTKLGDPDSECYRVATPCTP